jgi:uncharacterized protein YjbI with pentapeptide repeats
MQMPTSNAQIDYREFINQDLSGLNFEGIHFDTKFTGSTFRQCLFLRCRLDRVLMGKSHVSSRVVIFRTHGSLIVI